MIMYLQNRVGVLVHKFNMPPMVKSPEVILYKGKSYVQLGVNLYKEATVYHIEEEHHD